MNDKNEKENDLKETSEEAVPESSAAPAEEKEEKETEAPKKEHKVSKKELEEMKKACEDQKKAYDELSDKYTRMIAEYDNFRKRAQKEKDGIYADAYADAVKELLTVKDNLEMAVRFSDKEKFAEGVILTLNKFGDVLTKLGIEEFGAEGDEFDPNIHNAIMHTEEEGAKENTIVEVLQKGYKKGDKVIRYAMVKVVN
ncbi:MAG: nucleotide exchange factor GrpE [Firmicutes bacterium]|nr:nucleotide exchange factor GrpE [Bacillota bacterium]